MRVRCSDIVVQSLLSGLFCVSTASAQFVESELEFPVPIDSYRVLRDFADGRGSILLTGRSKTSEKYIGLYPILKDSVQTAATIEMSVPPEVLFFDAGQVGDEMKLLFLTPNGISELDLESVTLRPLIEIPSIFRTPSNAAVTELDFLRDVNEDGREDIVLSDFDGLRIALQTTEGFEATDILELHPVLRFNQGQPNYLVRPLYHFDFTLDGKKDLAIIEDNQFLVFERTEAGFGRQAEPYPIDIDLLQEGNERFEDRVVAMDQSDFRLSRIDKVADLNGDGLPDIMTITTISSGLFNKHTEYRVHLGRKSAEGVRYRSIADAEIPSDGIQVALSLLGDDDVSGKDLVSTSFRLGFGEIITALFSRSIKVKVELYRMGDKPLYSREPDYRAKVRLRFSLSTGFVNVPAVRFGDFDGDGSSDLMLQQDTEGLEIRLGDGSDFKSGKLHWSTTLPRDGTLIKVVDVNGDARQDVLVGYGRGDGDGMRNRLRILLGLPIEEDAR